jgi:hypothetical protein
MNLPKISLHDNSKNHYKPGHAGSSVQTCEITSLPSHVPHNSPSVVKHWRVCNWKPVLHVDEHDDTVKFVHAQYGHGSRIQVNSWFWIGWEFVSQHELQSAVVFVIQLLV